MSIFSKIKMSRKAAKEHKEKVVEKEVKAETKAPYKHIPTHAAVDALSGAPSSWKHEDRSKIKEHHKRRSQMALSRTGSSLSQYTGMQSVAGSSSQIPPLPRDSSYSSYNPTWLDRTGDMSYSNESSHRMRVPRGHSYHDSGIGPSPLASNVQSEEVSPVVSSGNSQKSNSSEDNLEMARKQKAIQRDSSRPQPIVYQEKDIFDRLHTSTTRKLGEAPLYDTPQFPVIVEAAGTATVTALEAKPKKQRWSLLGKKNSVAIAH